MPISLEGIRRGVEEHGRMWKALGRSWKRLGECGRHSEVSEAKQKHNAVEGALWKSVDQKAQSMDEAGQVRIRSDEKVSLLYPQTKGQA